MSDITLYRNLYENEIEGYKDFVNEFIQEYSLEENQKFIHEYSNDSNRNITNHRIKSINESWYINIEINGNYLSFCSNIRFTMIERDNELEFKEIAKLFVIKCNQKFSNLYIINENI